MPNITIRLSSALIEQLEALVASAPRDAALRGTYTRSDVIRDALVAHVQRQTPPSSGRVTVRSMRR